MLKPYIIKGEKYSNEFICAYVYVSFLPYNLEKKKGLLQKHVYFYSNAVLTKTSLCSTWYNLQNFYRGREERVNVDFYTPSIT